MLFNTKILDSQPLVENEKNYNFNRYPNINTNFADDKNLSEILPKIQMGDIIEFVTEGRWSSHHLVIAILKVIGDSELVFSTWAITETPLRALFKLKNEGKLKSIRALLESKVSGHNPKSFGFAKEFFDEIKTAHCHAKVTVLTNENFQVVINSSANWTENKRIESGTIICSAVSAEFHKKWILK